MFGRSKIANFLSANQPRAIVLLSGGLDSAVALNWTLRKNYNVLVLTLDFFGRSKKEIESVAALARKAKCPRFTFHLDFLKEIEDNQGILRNPLLKSAPAAYIPCRNIIFYGIASYLAEVTDSALIVGGHNKNDVESFRDASWRFFKQLNLATRIALLSGDRTGRIILPLARMSKTQVIRLGYKLKVPFELTWSCQKSNKKPCRKCSSCILRERSFRMAGLNDPLISG